MMRSPLLGERGGGLFFLSLLKQSNFALEILFVLVSKCVPLFSQEVDVARDGGVG